MSKIMGASLLGTACVLACWSVISDQKKRLGLLQGFADALERMEGLIRWQRLSVPRVLTAESGRQPCGEYFRKVRDMVKSGQTLQCAWQKVFSAFPEETGGDVLRALEWSGDTLQVTGNLRRGSAELRTAAAKLAQEQREKRRLYISLWASAALMLIIILA